MQQALFGGVDVLKQGAMEQKVPGALCLAARSCYLLRPSCCRRHHPRGQPCPPPITITAHSTIPPMIAWRHHHPTVPLNNIVVRFLSGCALNGAGDGARPFDGRLPLY